MSFDTTVDDFLFADATDLGNGVPHVSLVGIHIHLFRKQLNKWRGIPSRFILDQIHRMPGRTTRSFPVYVVTHQRVHRRTLPRTHPSRCCAGMAWQVPEPLESYTAAPSRLAV